MKHRTNGIGQFLAYLAHMSTEPWAQTQPSNGLAVYPYKIATTRTERMAHVKRRQSSNSGAGRLKREWARARWENGRGVSKKGFIDRIDGGYGD